MCRDGDSLELEIGPVANSMNDDGKSPLWLHVRIRAKLEALSAEIPATILDIELQDFAQQWKSAQALGSSLELWLVPMEPWVVIHLVHDAALVMYVRLMYPLGVGNVLLFSLIVEETALEIFFEKLARSVSFWSRSLRASAWHGLGEHSERAGL